MRREEKRKRFHEAVIKTLYPTPSPPESEEEEEKKPVILSERAVNFDLDENPEDFGERSPAKSDDEDDGAQDETLKLSRAQRKRLRKKKLKEDAFRRGKKMIGPSKPLSEAEHDEVGTLQIDPQGVRENAANEQNASCEKPGSSKRKLKQRRIAKRLAKEGLKSTETEKSDQDTEPQVLS
ncbi:hypothetical protein COLO4_11595 [Corchorus olitorius]|uniref:Uncharacterized protein n=1 Tax=Corchorus olitorius TaxID=93759 RepID=A0A1R3K3Y6_9ROSI|nr:hypothetical protein COLO4_11595 [Corchorus olitorius]